MRIPLLLASLLVLAACDHFDDDKSTLKDQVKTDAQQYANNWQDNVGEWATKARDNIKKTNERVRSWWLEPPPPPPPPGSVPLSYCYHVLQDILCYRQPMPGFEHRLVAYQGTGAEPPPPAMMVPLPLHDNDTSQLPASRVANAVPVFVEPPAPVKEEKSEDTTQPGPPVMDAAHQQLPNPALAPQL